MVLNRIRQGDTGTFGVWFDNAGKQLCCTVERPLTGVHPCVIPGIYNFEKYISPTKGDVWIMTNPPPGRSEIEIHPANVYTQLLGCIAPGDGFGEVSGLPAVLHSQATFRMLKATLPDSFLLTISDDTITS